MSNPNKQHFILRLSIILASIVIAMFMAAGVCAAAQSSPSLQITSPSIGAVVNPGQTISVTVTSPAGTSFAQVGVVGEDPIGFSSIATSVPAQFSITIPTDIACRPFMLTAVGTTSSGQSVQSATILIDLERPDLPTALSAQILGIKFKSLGEQFPIVLLAAFSDGSILDVTQSSNVVYSSSNTSIATVDANGLVTAVAEGTTSISVTYGQSPSSLSASVPVTVPRQALTASPASLSFGSQNTGTNSAPQQLTVTNAGNGPIRMLGVTATGDFSETDNCISSSPLAAGSSCAINVSFAPAAAGSRTGAVKVMNGFTAVPIAFSLTGTGVGVTKQPTSVAVVSSADPSVFGQSVSFTSTVSPSSGSGAPTGTITLNDGTNTIGTATLSGGQAALTISSFSVGSHSITAVYSGDGSFLGGTSGSLTQTVNKAFTNTALTSTANPITLGQAVSFIATVSVVSPGSGSPTGTLTFQDATTILGTVSLNSSASGSVTASSLAVGVHQVTAAYSGDGNFSGSNGNLTENVSYAICTLYDQTKSVQSGATFPIKLYLCDANGNDVSSSSILLHATQVTNVFGFSGDVEAAGNANPDNDFRFDSTLGPAGGYIFNLSTTGLPTGTYSLQFTAGSDPVTHSVNFGVK
jgi:Big-like domain-containing protein